MDGLVDGGFVGGVEGLTVGKAMGEEVGLVEGAFVGDTDGLDEGKALGEPVEHMNCWVTTGDEQVSPIFSLYASEPVLLKRVSVELDSRHRQPLGSLESLHQRFKITTCSISTNAFKSTSNHAFCGLVWENVEFIPSMALDASNLPFPLNNEDCVADPFKATLTPAE
jgi:hypothetical protein